MKKTVKLIDDIKDIGLKYGTICGQSVSLADIDIPANRDAIINEGKKKVVEVDGYFRRGLITKSERRKQNEDIWNKVTGSVAEALNSECCTPVPALII